MPSMPAVRRELDAVTDRPQPDSENQQRHDKEVDKKVEFQRHQKAENDPTDKRGGSVKIASQNHRDPAGEHVADDPAADGGEYSAQDDSGGTQAERKTFLRSDSGKHSESDRIAKFDDVALFYPESGRVIGEQTGDDADQYVVLVTERRHRGTADNAVTHDAAADTDAARQHRHAENVQPPPDALHSSSQSEHRSTEKVKHQNNPVFHSIFLQAYKIAPEAENSTVKTFFYDAFRA